MRKFVRTLYELFEDHNFLKIVHITENFVSKVLSIGLIFLIFISLYDLMIVVYKELLYHDPASFFNETLIKIFGFFLNILIALELLENITVYLRKHVVQSELVLVTALIAVARKIIIFDPYKDKTDLIALGIAILCLTIGYGVIRYSNDKNKN